MQNLHGFQLQACKSLCEPKSFVRNLHNTEQIAALHHLTFRWASSLTNRQSIALHKVNNSVVLVSCCG